MHRRSSIVDEANWLVENFSPTLSHAEVARKIGKPASWVLTRLRLLALSPEIIEAASDGRLTEKQVKRLTDTVLTVNRERIFRGMLQ